jgi:hypothetical protein
MQSGTTYTTICCRAGHFSCVKAAYENFHSHRLEEWCLIRFFIVCQTSIAIEGFIYISATLPAFLCQQLQLHSRPAQVLSQRSAP